MTHPATAAGRAGLAAVRAEPERALVVLDFDGTLADIVEHPGDARPVDGAAAALRWLAARVRLLAVVTGRAAPEVVELAGLAAIPGLVVYGHYGLQRWQAGRLSSPVPLPAVAAARDALPGLLADAGADPAVRVEDKTHSVAVHTRSAADPEAELARLDPLLRALAERSGLDLADGRLVRELRPPGTDKGAVVLALAAQTAAGAVLVAGDDTGDLPAFAAVRTLAAAGTPGCAVAVAGPGADPRVAAAADLVVDGPVALVEFVGGLVEPG